MNYIYPNSEEKKHISVFALNGNGSVFLCLPQHAYVTVVLEFVAAANVLVMDDGSMIEMREKPHSFSNCGIRIRTVFYVLLVFFLS